MTPAFLGHQVPMQAVVLVLIMVIWSSVWLRAVRRARRVRALQVRAVSDPHLALIQDMDRLLLTRLREYAHQLGVPVAACAAATLRDWRSDTVPRGAAIRRSNGSYEIWIRDDCVGDVWVLAHELGHVVAWRTAGTSTETEADLEAEKILFAVLTEAERDVLGPVVTRTMRARREAAVAQERSERDLLRRCGPRRTL